MPIPQKYPAVSPIINGIIVLISLVILFVVTYITEGPGEIIITVLANIKVIQSFTVIRIDCLPFAVAKRFV